MRNKLGTALMVCGVLLILGALALFSFNQQEAAEAAKSSEDVLPQLLMANENKTPPQSPEELGTPEELLSPEELVMTEVTINGRSYIGYLTIPALELELPIISQWTYNGLRYSPCRYAGTLKGNDLVLMAHNYPNHFGRISTLHEGDTVYFTDMDNYTVQYRVVALDVLEPTAVDEMTAGEYDLTLFTCTYRGSTRVTVYCDRIKNDNKGISE